MALLAVPSAAVGHSDLASTTPPAGAELESPPAEVVLVFEIELDPDGSAFAVTDENGGTVGEGELDLTVADRDELRGAVTIDEKGPYTVAWTSVAADGHRESGEFAFSYVSATEAANEAPNAAMRPPSRNLLLIGVGSVLVLIAIVLGLRWRRSIGR